MNLTQDPILTAGFRPVNFPVMALENLQKGRFVAEKLNCRSDAGKLFYFLFFFG